MGIQFGVFHHPACPLFGVMRLTWLDEVLVALDFDAVQSGAESMDVAAWMMPTLDWLAAYCSAGSLAPFPEMKPPEMKPKGTAFQRKVWAELLHIPWGESITYAELARRVASSPRAVGGALRANPLPIFIPCHRVVAASGLGGYAGASELGQARKRWLLQHEGGSTRV